MAIRVEGFVAGEWTVRYGAEDGAAHLVDEAAWKAALLRDVACRRCGGQRC